MNPSPDDLIDIFDDAAEGPPPAAPWPVLIVDDDPEVHAATRFALRDQRVLGRPLALSGAHSAAEALAILRANPDFAVVFLDVVMESADAGLRLVQAIRQELGLRRLRIILRTGQPGYAPELEVISRYDINDYRSKAELTQTRLLTSLTSALRSYAQISRLDDHRLGLTQIIQGTRDLLSNNGLQQFASGVLAQLGSFIGTHSERGLVLISPGALRHPGTASTDEPPEELVVVAASGPYARWINQPLLALETAPVREQLLRCLTERRNMITHWGCSLYCESERHHLAVFVDAAADEPGDMEDLLQMFTSNIALCADNLSLLDQVQQMAFVDPTTGLATRQQLMQRLESFPDDPDQALALLDVIDFNALVEHLGAAGSDALLALIGQRLRRRFGPQAELVARIGGDVFAVLAPADALGESAFTAFQSEPFEVDGVPIRLRVSVGVARRCDAPESAQQMMAAAHMALKLAKQGGLRHHAWYSPSLGQASGERTRLLHAMHAALHHGDFELALQPQWRLADGAILGVEALLRWRGPDGCPISPLQFVPVAEASGLIVPLGAWVMEEACRQLAELRLRTGHELCLCINVSAPQWQDGQLPRNLRALAQRHGLPPHLLEVELTESQAMESLTLILPQLGELRASGIRVALDDFGTGFSSLAYLQSMPIDRLKLDRQFVTELGRNDRVDGIARTVIALGRQLGLEVLAEGVETDAQAELLHQLGCDSAQGYLRGRPMPLDALCDWLAQQATVQG